MMPSIATAPVDYETDTTRHHMRKLASLATAMAILALGLPMQASAETTAKPMVKTEAAKVATVTATKAKVATVKKKHYAKRHHHHRMALRKQHRKHIALHKSRKHAAAHKTRAHMRHVKKQRKTVARNS
jgi:hypothetical protein